MDAMEFRVGNVYQYTNSNKLKERKRNTISTIIPDDILWISENSELADELIKFIEIDCEVLKSMGFYYTKHEVFRCDNEDFCVCYREPYCGEEGGYFIQNTNWSDAECNRVSFKPLKYAHKLQNLWYELTDEKLEINQSKIQTS